MAAVNFCLVGTAAYPSLKGYFFAFEFPLAFELLALFA